MAPGKFVPPAKRSGVGIGSSMSSLSFTSSSSQGSLEGKSAVSAQKPAGDASADSSEPKDKVSLSGESDSSQLPKTPAKKEDLPGSPQGLVADPLNLETTVTEAAGNEGAGFSRTKQVRFPAPKLTQKASKEKLDSNKKDGPPRKKLKVEPTVTARKNKSVEQSGDKENVCPVQTRKGIVQKDKPSKPCVSLTDEEYELIFQNVLSRCHSGTVGGDPEPEKPKDVSQDMFEEASQSDLEDIEQGEGESASTEKLKIDVVVENADTSPLTKVDGNAIIKTEVEHLQNGSVNSTQSVQHHTDNTADDITDVSKDAPSQSDITTPSPIIKFMCHPSQPNANDTSNIPQIKVEVDDFDHGDSCSQPLSSTQRQDAIPSTPLSISAAFGYHSPIAPVSPRTPRKVVTESTPLSQQENASPLSQALRVSRSNSSNSFQCPAVDNVKKKTSSQNIWSSNSSQNLKTPIHTPNRSSALYSSQGLNASADIPNNQSNSVAPTPQKTDQRGGSTAPSTPSCSQQLLSQEIQLTPPPPGTAKERLIWLQKKRQGGSWVQCDNEECGKWRYLPDTHDPTTLSEKWFCRMHPDEELNSCDAAEKRLSLRAEEDMIFNKYSPGSLVWARLVGYPWWPAMVEDDPDLEQFYWLNLFSDIPTWYHVVFFDDDNVTCTRAWIPVQGLKAFSENPLEEYDSGTAGFKKRIGAAFKKACSAQALSMEDRLARYSFASLYKGPIGGPRPRVKLIGDLGHRKPLNS